MRVLIVNTSERTGGAAVAANRLMEALNNHGVKAKMLVRDKETDKITVVGLPSSPLLRLHFLWERWCIFWHLHFNRKRLFEIDIANIGTDITSLPEFREADIIHLQWVNQGMLSLNGIQKILRSGKPVVWTMHDIWPATAICHLALRCRRFEDSCRHCRLLPNGGNANDLAARIWKKKQRMLEGHRVTFVACSQWLAGEARRSGLLKGQWVESIPNAIDTHVFCPGDKAAARELLGLPAEGRVILFISQRATNPFKGMSYLVEACRQIAAEHPDATGDITVAVMGGHAEEIVGDIPFRSVALGYVNDEQRIVAAYRAADVFVLPSLSENLPNTIMEAMACGVPCVGFRVGGIPEMIDHQKNGYVADYKNVDDLARGIWWTLGQDLGQAAIAKVHRCYSQSSVAMQYTEVYNQALAAKMCYL